MMNQVKHLFYYIKVMSREFKFRAWVKFDSGKYGMLDHGNLSDWTVNDLFDDIDETDCIMQDTGFKDRNGKSIFCGDIIELDAKITGDIATVYLDKTTGVWSAGLDDLCGVARYSQVIGNVHENQDLLTN